MLRLALLGSDPAALELAHAALSSDDYRLVAICGEAFPTAFSSAAQHVRREPHWEWLLHDEEVQAVIVGREEVSQREECLRKLVQAGKPLMLTFPPCEHLFALELEMIRRDSQGAIGAYAFDHFHPATLLLLSRLEELGAVELVSMVRRMPEVNRAAVRGQFAQDGLFFRALLGRIASVSATGLSPHSRDEANLAVALQSEAGAAGRWSVEPASHVGATLAVRGANGSMRLEMAGPAQPWRLETSAGEQLELNVTHVAEQPPHLALAELAGGVQGKWHSGHWELVCRDLAVADMVQYSLERGRTIHLHGDEVSERGTFKGMMAAGGCLLLLLALMVLFLVSIVEGLQAPFRDHILWRMWPLYLLAPIVVFLLLQLLQLAIRPAQDSSGGETDDASTQ